MRKPTGKNPTKKEPPKVHLETWHHKSGHACGRGKVVVLDASEPTCFACCTSWPAKVTCPACLKKLEKR